jgi:hypothetical protein
VSKRYFFRPRQPLTWRSCHVNEELGSQSVGRVGLPRHGVRELCDASTSELLCELLALCPTKVSLRRTALAKAHDDRLLLRIHGNEKEMDREGWRSQ